MKTYQRFFSLRNLPAAAFFLASFLAATNAFGQLSVDGDFRTRTEYRHGFQSLYKENADPAFFTSQRSRLILGFKDPRYQVKFSIQDVRIWGSQPQIATSDGLLSVHEAWVEYNFTRKFALRGGRMELAYDNHRILGNLDWAQQGRKHDLALLKFTDSTFAIHAGFAFNQDKEQHTTHLYTVPNSYKAMQFLWINKQLRNINASFLFLNNGTQFTTTNDAGVVTAYDIKYTQTAGVFAEYKKNKFSFTGHAYSQTGKDVKSRTVQAHNLYGEAGLKVGAGTTLSLGGEYLSGSPALTDKSINRSFAPLYGTNHLFNGYMDYFYVGNHYNNAGLKDLFVRIRQNVGKGFITLDVHHFDAAAEIINPETTQRMNPGLGTELDLTIRQNVTKELSIQAGYSQMLATDTMEVLKTGNAKANNNWAYLWLIFKPDFLKKKA